MPKTALLKKLMLVVLVAGFSALVAADCAKDCQQEYDDCMKVSSSVAKEKICGEILRECKLACATNGE